LYDGRYPSTILQLAGKLEIDRNLVDGSKKQVGAIVQRLDGSTTSLAIVVGAVMRRRCQRR
jgi:hypothetical protein